MNEETRKLFAGFKDKEISFPDGARVVFAMLKEIGEFCTLDLNINSAFSHFNGGENIVHVHFSRLTLKPEMKRKK